MASWFITGALAGLAGAAIPLWEYTNLGYSDTLMIDVMAGSVLGGLDNIYGAIIGGAALAFIQTALPGILLGPFGLGIAKFKPLIPIAVIIVILMYEPKGITEILARGSRAIKRKRQRSNGKDSDKRKWMPGFLAGLCHSSEGIQGMTLIVGS